MFIYYFLTLLVACAVSQASVVIFDEAGNVVPAGSDASSLFRGTSVGSRTGRSSSSSPFSFHHAKRGAPAHPRFPSHDLLHPLLPDGSGRFHHDAVYLDTYFVEGNSGVLMHGKYKAKAASHAGLPVSLDHSLPVHHVACRDSEGARLHLTLNVDALAALDTTAPSRSVHSAVHALFPVGSMVMGNAAHGMHDCGETFYTRVEQVSVVPHPTNASRVSVYLDGERTEWMDLYEYADIELRNFHNVSAATAHAAKRGLLFPASFPSDEPSASSMRVSWNYDEVADGPVEPKDLISVEAMHVFLTCDECYLFIELDFVFHTILELYWFPFPHVEPTFLLLEVDQRVRMELNMSLEFQTAMTINLWEYAPDCLKATFPPSYPLGCSSNAPGDAECPASPRCLPNPGVPFGPLAILFTLKPQIDLEVKSYYWLKFYNLGVQSRTTERTSFRWSRADSPALPQISYENAEADGGGMRVLVPGMSLKQRTPPKVRVRLGFGPQLKMTWWGKAFPVSFRFTPMIGVRTLGATCDDGSDGVAIEPVWGVAQTLRVGLMEDLRIFGKKVSFRVEGAIPAGYTSQLLSVQPIPELATCLSFDSLGTWDTPFLPVLSSGTPQGAVLSPAVQTDGSVNMMGGSTDSPIRNLCESLSSCGACLVQGGCMWCAELASCHSAADETSLCPTASVVTAARSCSPDDVSSFDANIDLVQPLPADAPLALDPSGTLLVPGKSVELRWLLSRRLVELAGGQPHFYFALRAVADDELTDGTGESGLDVEAAAEEALQSDRVWFCGFGLPCLVSSLPEPAEAVPAQAREMDMFSATWQVSADIPNGYYQLVVYHQMEVSVVSAFLYVENGASLASPVPVGAMTSQCSHQCGTEGVARVVPACVGHTLVEGGGKRLVVQDATSCGASPLGPLDIDIPCNRVDCVETQLELVRPTRADFVLASTGSPLTIEWVGGRTDGMYHVEFLMPDCSTWVQVGYTKESVFMWFYPFVEYFAAVSGVGLPTWELSTRFRVTLHSNPDNFAVSPHALPMFQVAPKQVASRELRMTLYKENVGSNVGFVEIPDLIGAAATATVGTVVEFWGRGFSPVPLSRDVVPGGSIYDVLNVLSLGPGRSVGVAVEEASRSSWTYLVLHEVTAVQPPYADSLRNDNDLIVIQNPYLVVQDFTTRELTDSEVAALETVRGDLKALVCWRRWDVALSPGAKPLGGDAGVHFCGVPTHVDLLTGSGIFADGVNVDTAPCVDDYERGSLPFTNLHNTNEKSAAYRSVADDAEDRTGLSLGVLLALSISIVCLCGLALFGIGAAVGIRVYKRRSTRAVHQDLAVHPHRSYNSSGVSATSRRASVKLSRSTSKSGSIGRS